MISDSILLETTYMTVVSNKTKKKKPTFWEKWQGLIKMGIFLFTIPLVLVLSLKHPKIKQYIKTFVIYLRKNKSYKTYSIFIVFSIITSILISNASIPNLIAGMIFGMFHGSIVTIISVLISGFVSFCIARYFMKGRINYMLRNNIFMDKYYKILIESESKFTNKEYVELIFLSRLAPIAPYHLFSYFWGISDSKTWTFLIGSLGVIPSVIFETYIGSQIKDIDKIFTNKTKYIHLLIMIIISIGIGWFIKKKIDNIINDRYIKLS